MLPPGAKAPVKNKKIGLLRSYINPYAPIQSPLQVLGFGVG